MLTVRESDKNRSGQFVAPPDDAAQAATNRMRDVKLAVAHMGFPGGMTMSGPGVGTGLLHWVSPPRTDQVWQAELTDESVVTSRKLLAKNIAGNNDQKLKTINALEEMANAGRLAEAEPLARILTGRFPNDGFGWKALGLSLLQKGRIWDALEALQKAASLWPQDPAVHNGLGVALFMLDNLAEAETSCRRALQLEPSWAEAHNNLGCTLQRQGRFAESEASLCRALEIESDYVDAHFNLGATLEELGRVIEAEASYLRALEIMPDYAKAIVALGIANSRKGRFAEAEAMFQRALTIEREIPAALMAAASVRTMTIDDVAWISAAEKALEQNYSPRETSRLHYALGKFYDDVQDFDRAFLNYRRANELSALFGERYERQKQTRLVNQICRTYDRKRVKQVRDGASDSERPLFIVGMPRSGTSLVEQILASHPAVFGAGELEFWPHVLVNHMSSALGGEFDDTLLGELTQACLKNMSGFAPDALRVIDKMSVNFLNLGLIHAAFPNARILHMMRNPMDTCLSIYFQNFSNAYHYSNDLADLAHYYSEYHRLMAHWRAVLPPEIFLDVPYEAIVQDQDVWSRKLIAFIGLEWDERCLDFHQTERRVKTASQWQVRQKMYNTAIDRWRNYEKFIEPLRGLPDPLSGGG